MLTDIWPFSWEFWMFQIGNLDLYDPQNHEFRSIIARVAAALISQRVIAKIVAGQELH